MSTIKNDRYLRALLKQPVDKTPVWIMRQAGRYLPEYREIRAKAGDFMSLCRSPELACEVTLQPLKRYELDAAILFSDILTIPDAMGLGLYFTEGEGPKFKQSLTDLFDVQALKIPDIEKDLSYVIDAVRTIKRELHNEVPLIGFAGSPWTLACYMIEGGSSRNFSKIKKLAYYEPEVLHLLLSKLVDATIDYLNAQIAAGADSIMIFDTWGGVLSPSAYREFSLTYMAKLIEGLTPERDGKKIPTTLFTKNGGLWIKDIADTGCDAVGLDWTIDLAYARELIGDKVALQGNMDPAVLFGTPQRIKQEVQVLLDRFGNGTGHVFNLGHGITPDVHPDHVKVLVDSVHSLSQGYHIDNS